MRVNDIETLSRILAENAARLGEFIERDPRGRHVQPALAALSQHLSTQQGGIIKEVESLGEAIERIRSLVKSQQSFAVKAVTEEPVDVREQIRKAISLTEKASGPDASLEFVYELAEIPDLLVDRHRLLEILVNIIQNARQAMDAHENHPKRLLLRTSERPRGRVRIEVSDSGVGIVKENLVKVFTLGFTTKPNGHGFGLHAAANAATEIDGSLTVHSDGPGMGATFVLEIPMRVAPVLATAGAGS
jgi:signal transduction histidine kinase